jgi:heme/copper-type cytochrome/quinol oxidase subunit 3
MSQAAAMHAHGAVEPAESPLTPESWGKLGMWIFLAGDAVGFGTLLAGYGAMRATSADWPSPYEVLGINLTAIMTFCSSARA